MNQPFYCNCISPFLSNHTNGTSPISPYSDVSQKSQTLCKPNEINFLLPYPNFCH